MDTNRLHYYTGSINALLFFFFPFHQDDMEIKAAQYENKCIEYSIYRMSNKYQYYYLKHSSRYSFIEFFRNWWMKNSVLLSKFQLSHMLTGSRDFMQMHSTIIFNDNYIVCAMQYVPLKCVNWKIHVFFLSHSIDWLN